MCVVAERGKYAINVGTAMVCSDASEPFCLFVCLFKLDCTLCREVHGCLSLLVFTYTYLGYLFVLIVESSLVLLLQLRQKNRKVKSTVTCFPICECCKKI